MEEFFKAIDVYKKKKVTRTESPDHFFMCFLFFLSLRLIGFIGFRVSGLGLGFWSLGFIGFRV